MTNYDNTNFDNTAFYAIVIFNNSIRADKTYSNNLWFNGCVNSKIASIDYIEVKE